MPKLADITFENNQFFLVGDLDYSNVMSLYAKSFGLLNKIPELQFDFSQLKSSDSSGLALLIEWLKFAKRFNKPIRFNYLSQEMISIAKAAGIEKMICS